VGIYSAERSIVDVACLTVEFGAKLPPRGEHGNHVPANDPVALVTWVSCSGVTYPAAASACRAGLARPEGRPRAWQARGLAGPLPGHAVTKPARWASEFPR
jgi:hypothetical protein